MASSYTCFCVWSGVRMTMKSASFAASAGVSDAQSFLLGDGAALRALGESDADVDAGITERQRVRVPLAAVANDRDAAAGEAGEVGVGVVVERGHRADS